MGNRAGCYRSPVQFGSQVRIGLLAFYPAELDFENIERQLMEKFDFKIPLGLQWEWVALPYDGRTKWSDRQPGIRLWHIYCPKDAAAHVDRTLRQLLNPNTLKKDYPWAAVTHYISDWRATEAGLASVRSCGVVKDNLVTMVSKARDFQDLTTVMYSDAELPGMLKQAQTTHFGKSTLLKILLSIKATPAQAAAAEQDRNDDSSEDEDEVQVSEEGSDFIKVARKSKQKGLKEALDASSASMTPAQLKAEQAKEMKRQADQQNSAPSPLFLMILPGEMIGTYIFVSRLKYTSLAKNVIQGLVPFLLHHLEEPDSRTARKVLAKWISKSAIHRAERRNLVWNTETLSATEANSKAAGIDDGLDFLEFGMDIMDSFKGTLSIDMEMAEAKDIDDGATVAGALADLMDSQSQLKEARQQVQSQQLALDESKAQLTITANALQDSVDALEDTEKALQESEKRRQLLERRFEEMQKLSKPDSLSSLEQKRLQLLAQVEQLEQEKALWNMAKAEGESKATDHHPSPTAPTTTTSDKTVTPLQDVSPPRTSTTVVGSPQIQSPPTMRTASPGDQSSAMSTPQTPSFAPYPPPPPKPNPSAPQQPQSLQPSSVTPMGDTGSRGAAPGDPHGDSNLSQDGKSTRVVFQNVNGLPAEPSLAKQQQINKWLKEEMVGIALFAETNRHWSSLPDGTNWRERVRQVATSGHFAVAANNTHENRASAVSSFQWGGCAAAVFNDTAHSAKECGVDPSGLGRWSFIRLRGRRHNQDSSEHEPYRHHDKDLVVISAYRPNHPGQGESTVWAQHRLYWMSKNRLGNPRDLFTTDLAKAIKKWRLEGCEVILGIDANEDVSVFSPTSFRYRMHSVGLSEAILRRHPRPMATYQRNQKNVPIDGLFVSDGVKVTASGYYGFDEFYAGDHRALWMDIDLSQTLGSVQPTKKKFQPRELSTQDDHAVRRYLTQVQREYVKFDILNCIQAVAEAVEALGSFTPKLERQYNCIHRQAYAIRRSAEKDCRRKSMGKVPWSPAVQQHWDRLALWKILIKSHLRCRVSSRKVRRLLKKTGLTDAWRFSLDELQQRLKEERQQYNQAKKKKVIQWRREHIDRLLRDAKKKRWKSAKARKCYLKLRRMKQREEARRRRRARGKCFNGGLKAIQIPRDPNNPEGDLVTITDQRLVEQGCMDENRARYDQTRYPYPTPPMQEPLYSMFNGDDAEANSSSLLQGALEIPKGVDKYTLAFLDQCRFHKGFIPQSLSVDVENHRHYWSRADETKGSEPHGLHNGHFKAGAQSPLVAYCDAVFRHLPLVTGFVPEQWKNLMNFAIEKKPGDFRLAKMRTIQMMNSEFQTNNKMVGRKAMQFAETNGLIPDGQCGSRKKHQAIDLALSKRLVWDLLIMQRRAAGWISNDAKSCFDRIVHSVAIIALLRFGIMWSTLMMMFRTLSSSTHRVRTGFGDSEEGFFPPSDIPYQGCGQGNGAGPPIWVAVSSILILMMESAGFGFECLTALSSSLVTAQCFSFVDDTEAIEAADHVDQSVEDILRAIQLAALLWSGGIRATGGAINPDKSFCWLLDFKWDSARGTWKFRDLSKAEGLQVQIFGLQGELKTLRQLKPSQAERTLGVMLAPLEDHSAQLKFVEDKAKEWAEVVRSGFLQRYDVFPLIQSTILKSLEYPSPLSTLSYEEWTRVMMPVLQVCLPKAGVCRSFPRDVVYAPLQFQGFGIMHPFTTQVYHHLDMLLRHAANRTPTFKYLNAALEAHQLETGTSYGLLQQEYSNTAILASETWLKRIWKILQDYGIYVAFDSLVPSFRTEGDALLMDVFIDLEVDQDDLMWLNWCRCYLHVVTVSDLVTADGTRIRKSIWEGVRDSICRDAYHWPRVAKPSRQRWELWRRMLTSALLLSPTQRLHQPLGDWIDEMEDWNWLYSKSHSVLFHRHQHLWVPYTRVSSRPSSRNFRRSPSMQWWESPLPSDVQRATVDASHLDHVRLTGVGVETAPPPPSPAPSILNAWQRASEQVTEFVGWVPDEVRVIGSEERLVEALLRGELWSVSDGSYEAPLGTSATILTTETGDDRIIVLAQTPGRVCDQSAYRSEVAGVLCGITSADWLLQEWRPRSKLVPRVLFGCDGKSALQRIYSEDDLPPSKSQFDILSATRRAIEDSSISPLWEHIYGHKDKHLSWEQLTRLEQLNVEADEMAGVFRRRLLREGIREAPNARFFTEPVSWFLDGVKQ